MAVQDADKLPGLFEHEMVIGKAKMSRLGEDATMDQEERRDYVSAESTVLLHHAAEALVRLYLAHADDEPCPWLEVARLRRPGEFKSRTEAFLTSINTSQTQADLMRVFTGHPEAPAERADMWNSARDGLVILIGHLARTLLTDGALYNAAKHGLAIRSGAAEMSLGSPDSDFAISAEGPSISYIDLTDGDNGKRWSTTTSWIQVDENIALTHIASMYIQSLWHIAAHRYTGAAFDQAEVKLFGKETAEAVFDVSRDKAKMILVPSMSMSLLYYKPDGPEVQTSRGAK
jgi:hypothetical protein